MRITKWGEYAILFCMYLAKREVDAPPAGATEIGGAYDIPTQYAQQILHRLRKGNIIKSVRGPHGGFKLNGSAHETNLKQVLYAAEGTTFEVVCENNDPEDGCPRMGSNCSLKFVWHDLKNSVDTLLEQTTLAMLVERQDALTNGTLINVNPRGSQTEASDSI